MGFLQESIGLSKGFALTAIAYLAGAVVFAAWVDKYCQNQKNVYESQNAQ